MLAEILAFFNNSSATNRSLLEASGSFKMFDSCCHKQNVTEGFYRDDTSKWREKKPNSYDITGVNKCSTTILNKVTVFYL